MQQQQTEVDREGVRRIAQRFIEMDLTEQAVLGMSCKDVIDKIRVVANIQTAEELTTLLQDRTGFTPAQWSHHPQFSMARAFLASFLFAYHGEECLGGTDPVKLALRASSRALVDFIWEIMGRLAFGEEEDLAAIPLDQYKTLMESYIPDYYAWKIPDEQQYIEKTTLDLVTRYRMYDLHRHLEPAESARWNNIEADVRLLRGRLSRTRGLEFMRLFDLGLDARGYSCHRTFGV